MSTEGGEDIDEALAIIVPDKLRNAAGLRMKAREIGRDGKYAVPPAKLVKR